MKIAVLSDIQGNAVALDATLDHVDRVGVDLTVALGDLVGLGAQPGECLDVLRQRPNTIVLAGEYDRVATGRADVQRLRDQASAAVPRRPDWDDDLQQQERGDAADAVEAAIAYTKSALTSDQHAFLDGLLVSDIVDIGPKSALSVFHGALNDPWIAATGPDAGTKTIEAQWTRLAVCGHIRLPGLQIEGLPPSMRSKINMGWRDADPERDKGPYRMVTGRYLICPGAVGVTQASFDPGAWWALINTAAPSVRFHRLDYDIESAQRRMLEVGLPSRLADALHPWQTLMRQHDDGFLERPIT